MSRIEQFVNNPRFQGKVRAMFGIDGANPIPHLGELQSVVVLENDRFESRFMGNELSFIGGVSVPAGGAGNASSVALLNPSGSNILMTIEGWNQGSAGLIGAVAASVILANYTQAPNNFITRDFRGTGGAGQIWTRNTAGAPTERARINGVGDHYIEFSLAPNQAIVFSAVATNTIYEASIWWRERELELATK